MNEQAVDTVRLRDIPIRFGRAWTAFWFTPSDPIVLSLLRVLVGAVALWWYLSFLPDLWEWFGPEGVFSLDMAQSLRGGRAAISLLDFVNSSSQLWLVYGLGVVALVMMICGVLTRVSTIAALIFVLSFIHRAPMLTRYVEGILPMLMFYLCLGPSGACLSVDACIRQRRRPDVATIATPSTVSSAATVAIRVMQVHLVLVYAAMAIAQLQGDKWWQGTAVWWLMARPESRLVDLTGLSSMGTAFEYLINLCTYAIVLYEIGFAVLIWNPLARPILLLLGIFVWGGLALIGGSVSFCVLMLAATLAFLRPETLRNWCARCGIEKLAAGKMAAA